MPFDALSVMRYNRSVESLALNKFSFRLEGYWRFPEHCSRDTIARHRSSRSAALRKPPAEFFCRFMRRIPIRDASLYGREVSFLTFVIIRPNESQDQLLKRFRKKVVKSGVLSTVRRKRWFISKSELRRVEKKKAIRRIKRRQMSKMGE